MRRNNNLATYSAIILVCAAALFMLFRQRVPFGRGNTDFAVDGKTEITRVVFFEKDMKLVLSKNSENEWIAGKNVPARDEAVRFLIKVLKEMKVKSPVTSDTFTEEIVREKIEPVKVHVYERRRLRKSLFVYRTGSNMYGNIMKMRASSKPYIMFVPGYETDIGSYFTADPLFWQPFIIFNFMPSEIEEVVLQNYSDTSASFRIIHNNKNISLLTAGGIPAACCDTTKVRRYISYFTYIPFERWATELTGEKKEEIKSLVPLFRINLKTKEGQNVSLTIWQKSMTSDEGKEVVDNDRVWGKTGDIDEIFVMRYFDIDPVLKKISYFCNE
ncbi:MAG TPA: hypothetical protein PLX87_10520 [Bacteroidales bacterium]|nr:hypothetical protein [Bacteroidales bacterium]HPP93736.1 hypothetical protein [Bacteroidales bacterium]